MRFFRNWVYSNIHIAFIAALLSLETNVLFNIKPIGIAPGFIFCATLLIYNLGYFNAMFSSEDSYREQARWMKSRMAYWIFSMLVALLALLYLVTKFGILAQLMFFLFGFITFLYIKHDTNLFRKLKSIRSIPYLKVFIVAFVWSAITIMPQLVDSSVFLTDLNWEWLFFERFFFILSITLMFDVRDLNNDPKYLHTIPQTIGIKQSKWLSVLFLLFASLGLYSLDLNMSQVFGVLLVYLVTLLMINLSQPGKDDIYFTGWFDGVMGLHALAIIVFNNWA